MPSLIPATGAKLTDTGLEGLTGPMPDKTAKVAPPSAPGDVAIDKATGAASVVPQPTYGPAAPMTGIDLNSVNQKVNQPVPDVKPFMPTVNQTMDSRSLADAFSKPATLPPDFLDLMRKADEAAAVGDVTAAEKYRQTYLEKKGAGGDVNVGTGGDVNVGTGGDVNASKGGDAASGAGNAGNVNSSNVPGLVTADQIKSLFPDTPSIADEYASLRDSSGLTAAEGELADVNKRYADLSAVIANIENDVRTELGGNANSSFFQAAVADRIRKIKPEFDRLTNLKEALTSNVNTLRADVLQQVGLTQNDVTNKRNERNDVRAGVMDMFANFGSQVFKSMDPSIVAELERRGGFLPGQLASGNVSTIAERQLAQSQEQINLQKEQQRQNAFQAVTVNNSLYTFDKSTGKYADSGIVVPEDKKDQFSQYVEIAKTFADPVAALDFIRTMANAGTAGKAPQGGIDRSATVGSLDDASLSTLIKTMAKREGYGADPSNRPTRNNNPLNIKVGGATQHWIDQGLATVDPVTATDGGQFLKFKDVATGLQAAAELITSSVYSGLPLDAALKKWSGGGYGAEILPDSAVASPDALKLKSKVNDLGLSATQKGAIAAMDSAISVTQAIKKYVADNKIQIGPISGYLGKAAGATGVGADKKFETLRAMIDLLNANVQHAISGAQMTEAEAKRFQQWIPQVTNDEIRFNANADNLITGMKDQRNQMLKDPVTGKVPDGLAEVAADDYGSYSYLFSTSADELPFTVTASNGVTASFATKEQADQWKGAVDAYLKSK